MTQRYRAEEFHRFLNLIHSSVPEHLDVHIVLDNFSTHKTPSIQRWLEMLASYDAGFSSGAGRAEGTCCTPRGW